MVLLVNYARPLSDDDTRTVVEIGERMWIARATIRNEAAVYVTTDGLTPRGVLPRHLDSLMEGLPPG